MSGESTNNVKEPSERDVRIYVRHKVEGYSLRRVGAEVELHPTRILQIVREVEPWAVRQLVAETPDRMTKKLLAAARLERIYSEAMRGWRRSLNRKKRKTRKTGGKFGDSSETMIEEQAGDSTMLARAIDAQKQLNELWGLSEPKKHHHEGHLDGVVQHVAQPLSNDERAARVLAHLEEEIARIDAEIERRGIVIDVPSSPGSGKPAGDRPGEPDGKPD